MSTSTASFGPTSFVGTQGMPLREDQFLIQVGVQGITLPKTAGWTSMEGGDVSSESTFTRPGALVDGLQLGGPASRGDATVKRQYTDQLAQGGATGYINQLMQACGLSRMYISWTPLDANADINGNTLQMTGVLKEIQTPMYDANATAAAFLTLVMAADVAVLESVFQGS